MANRNFKLIFITPNFIGFSGAYFFCFLFWAVLSFSSLRAQTIYSSSSTAFPVLSIGVGARAVGMGESFTAVADDVSAYHYNPAGLAQIWHPELSLSHNSYLADGYYETAEFAYPLPDWGTLAFGVNYFDYGAIENRDSSGNLSGSYNPYDISFGGAFGFPIVDALFAGFRTQWIKEDISGTGYSCMVWDLGLLSKLQPNFSIGFDLKNIGVESGNYNLPLELLLGVAYRIAMAQEDRHTLLLTAEMDNSFQNVSSFKAGFEYAFQNRYFIRAGCSTDLTENNLEDVNGLSFGAGAALGHFQLDYAFTFEGDLGNVQRLSLSMSFPPYDKPKIAKEVSSQAGSISESASSESSKGRLKPVLLKFKVVNEENMSARQLFDLGKKKEKERLILEALDLYIKATDKEPGFKPAWDKLAHIYYDKSMEAYQKILDMDPENASLREWLEHNHREKNN